MTGKSLGAPTMNVAAMQRYLGEVAAATAAVDIRQLADVAEFLLEIWHSGATVYTLGNGGSAGLASHMACDLAKNTAPDLGDGPHVPARKRLRVVGLADNVAMLTALGNDIDFADIYLEQLKMNLVEADMVLAISGSGASSNVLRALHYARTVGATTVAFTSARASAAPMIALANHVVLAPVESMEQIEDLHVIFNHVLTVALRERIAQVSTA